MLITVVVAAVSSVVAARRAAVLFAYQWVCARTCFDVISEFEEYTC